MVGSTTNLGPWTQRRLGILTGAGLVLVLGGALLPIVLPRPSPVTRAAFERIERGMTRAEVEDILGGPPGDYRTRPGARLLIDIRGGGSMPVPAYRSFATWEGDEGIIEVTFDRDIVEDKDFAEVPPRPVAAWELVCWRLERAWGRLMGGSK
jgi:hypothetical protein